MSTPLYEKVYVYLRSEIDRGRYGPGDLLPTEQQLARQFGVSRITTKRALQMLAAEGVIDRHPGRGSFVTPQTEAVLPAVVGDETPAGESDAYAALIGLVLPEFADSYGLKLLSGIEQGVDERGAFLTVARSYGEQSLEEKAIHKLLALGVKGLIVFPVNGENYNPEILRLHLNGFPLVFIDKYLPGIPVPSLTTANTDAAYALAKHLTDLGHERIAFFSPPIKQTITLEDRFEGYSRALRDAGYVVDPTLSMLDLPSDMPTDPDSGYNQEHEAMIAEFLARHRDATAVFATEYQVAVHVWRVAKKLSIRVPEDLSIGCFDSPHCGDFGWRFTHVQQDEEAMGTAAVELLMSLIDRGVTTEVPSSVLSARLIVGDSTGPAAKARTYGS